MTRFYFIRHGESVGNLEKFFQGQLDIPLSPLGKKQAKLTADYFKDIHIDRIYSSDLERTMYTAELIGASKGIRAIPDSEFREIFAGDWQGTSFEKLANQDEEYSVWLSCIDKVKCPNGESFAKMQSRVAKRTEKIALEHPGESIIIVTHGGPIRAMCSLWENRPASETKWVSNSSVTIVDYDGNGNISLIKRGYDGHLGSISTIFGKNV